MEKVIRLFDKILAENVRWNIQLLTRVGSLKEKRKKVISRMRFKHRLIIGRILTSCHL